MIFIKKKKIGDENIVEMLLNHQAEPNTATRDGETPLFAGMNQSIHGEILNIHHRIYLIYSSCVHWQ